MEPANQYETVDVLRRGNVGARITRRMSAGGFHTYSFAFFRVYPRDGLELETYWLSVRNADEVASLLDDVRSRIQLEEKNDRQRAARTHTHRD